MGSGLEIRSPDARGAEGRGSSIRIAAVDIGSNSIRQIVADVSDAGEIRVVDEMKAAPRLGTRLDATGELTAAAMQRATDALARMATLARRLDAAKIEVVATSAVRDAANRDAFIERVREATGLRVRVLAGEEEARLSFRSALAHFDLAVGRAVVMDIGGGSLEFALSADGLVERLISLPFGAIRLTEQYLGTHPRARDVQQLRRAIRADIRTNLPRRDWRNAQIIGSGGTFTNLAGMYLARHGMAVARSVHGTRVPRVEVEHILDVLTALTPSERPSVPGLNAGRSDIIIAGLAVIAEMMARLDSQALTVSGYGIREGLLLETAEVRQVPQDPGAARERSVRAFAERCHFEQPHSEHVQRIALQIFDAVGERLGCERGDRALLADAGLLHDVGYHINYDKHHKHSYHLIVHAELLGMSPEERVAVANIARYHRGAEPKRKHANFGPLERALRGRIVRLAAILRVADGFDRGHVGAVERVEVEWTDRALRLRAVPSHDARTIRLELWGASRKCGLLSAVAGVPVAIIAPDGAVVEPDDGERQSRAS